MAAVLLNDRRERSLGTDERHVMDELERKYDMVLDKLLEEALRNKFGEGEWEKMTPQEKQRHLVKLKLQNRKLRQEGRLEEANELLGGLLDDSGSYTHITRIHKTSWICNFDIHLLIQT